MTHAGSSEGAAAGAAAVIVGAGEGTRLGAGVRKAWVDVGGESLLERSARAFAGVPGVVERVLVVHPDDVDEVAHGAVAARLRPCGPFRVAPGGATRQASTLAGVRATSPSVRDVLVHDAARPFVRPERIAALLAALASAPAALLASRVAATVKRAGDDGRVLETVPRDALRLAATPQGGRRELLLRLLENAERDGFVATDEASLFERAGVPPTLVDDDATNLKVTTPGDLLLARGL
ncbi:MAG TPA: 2-C-methyl-D-erythritol 4-phosphate cytidylyltransferase, partial [Planctomycetota bacterium]|nr:2-C-methyl-D-erythritol 4-phosphate cytidylyltransferase [Planctomycetota bacterium]